MKYRSTCVAVAAAAAMALGLSNTASAGLVYDSAILAPAQGFGTAPRDLTLQATGQDTFESGGLGVSAIGALVFGSVIADGLVHLGNGVTNQGGTTSLPSPLVTIRSTGFRRSAHSASPTRLRLPFCSMPRNRPGTASTSPI